MTGLARIFHSSPGRGLLNCDPARPRLLGAECRADLVRPGFPCAPGDKLQGTGRGSRMRRREFMAALAEAVAAAPALRLLPAAAQQAEKLRRVGVLLGFAESNPEQRAFFAAFVEELARLGWVDGRNVRIEQRWTNADKTRAQTFAAELVASQPDVILCATTPVTAALHQATATVPVVFTTVSDPVGGGFHRRIAASRRQHDRIHPHLRRHGRQVGQSPQGYRPHHQTRRHHIQPRHGAGPREPLLGLVRRWRALRWHSNRRPCRCTAMAKSSPQLPPSAATGPAWS